MRRAMKKTASFPAALLAMLLCVCACVASAPVSARADDAGDEGGASVGAYVTFVGGTAYTEVKMWAIDGFSIRMTPTFAANPYEIMRDKMELQVVAAGNTGEVVYSWTRVLLDEYGEPVGSPQIPEGADDSAVYSLYRHTDTLSLGQVWEYRVTGTDAAGNVAYTSMILVVSRDYVTKWLPDDASKPRVYGLSVHRDAEYRQTDYGEGSAPHAQLQNLAGDLLLADTAYQIDVGGEGAAGAVPFIGTLDVYLPVSDSSLDSVTVVGLDDAGNKILLENVPVLPDGTVKITTASLGVFAVAYPPSSLPAGRLATVVATAGEGGLIDPEGTKVYAVGSRARYVLFPEDGYVVDKVTVDGNVVQVTGNSYTFESLSAGAHSIHATFAKVSSVDPETGQTLKYSVTARVEGAGGLVMLDGYGPSVRERLDNVLAGTPVQVQVVPDRGCRLAKMTVQVAGGPAQEMAVFGNMFRISAVTGDTVVTVSFEQGAPVPVLTHTVTVECGEGGSVSPATQTIPHGGRAVFAVVPDEGYRVQTVLVNGVERSSWYKDGVLTIPGVLGELDVQIVFTDQPEQLPTVTHTIAAGVSGLGGSISPSGEVLVVEGEDATFYFYPDSGYRVAFIVVDGEKLPYTASSYTFVDVRGPHTIEVTYCLAGISAAATGDSTRGAVALVLLAVASTLAACLLVVRRRKRRE